LIAVGRRLGLIDLACPITVRLVTDAQIARRQTGRSKVC
jgi:hypothetical protein